MKRRRKHKIVRGAVRRRHARKKLPFVGRKVKYAHRRGYAPKVKEIALADGTLPKYGWPGGYPMYYVVTDEYGKNLDVACPRCASGDGDLGHGDKVIDYDVNWEDPDMYCSACNERIESAYAEKD